MKSVFSLAFILLLLGLSSPLPAAEGLQEFTRAIKREFDITANGTTSITNKYGKVDIKTWDRNRVKIDVTIVVNASSESAAQDVFERIDVAFSNSSGYVKAVTTIQPREKGIWNWATGTEKSDYTINYEVYLPETNNLEINHQYGDAYVAALSGKVTANFKYANAKLEKVSNSSDINFAYGNGTIVRANDLLANASYAKLLIKEAQNVEINSKYTQVSIDRAADIRSNSGYDTYRLGAVRSFTNVGKYDNIDIQSAENVEVNARYSQVKAMRVSRKLDLDLQYGGAQTGLAKSFSEVSLNGSYTDFKLSVEPGAEYQIDAAASYAGIAYPQNMTVTYELEKGSSHELKAYQGQKNGPVIRARLSYGGLRVKEQ